MKSIYRTLLVLFIFAGLASCDDEPVGESYNDDYNPDAQFRVDINGETFYADQYGVYTSEEGITEIIGKRNDGARVHFKITGAGEDTYILNGSNSGSAFYYDGVNPEPYDMTEIDTVGVLTISDYDMANGVSSGTFSFKAYREEGEVVIDTTESDSTDTPTPGIGLPDTLDFTNGSFTDIPLTVEGYEPEDPTPGDTINKFQVELDGELYETNNTQANISIENGLVIDTQEDSISMTLNVFDPEIETVDLDGENPGGNIVYIPNTEEETYFEATEGSITISEIDYTNNLISGTFTGVLTDSENPGNTIQMTNGSFDGIAFESDISVDDFMFANIGGENFNAFNLETEEGEAGLITTTGTNQSENQLQLTFPSSVNEGSYTVSNEAAFSGIYYKKDDETEEMIPYYSVHNSGNIVITEKDGTILTGTFTMSVRNDAGEVIQITEGEFKTDIAL